MKLKNGDVHIWTIAPDQIKDPDLLRELEATLTQDEVQKVKRYRLAPSQHAALITRAFLRFTLSLYSQIKPSEWRFSYSDLGKPEISNPQCKLRFNLSHNNNLIVCAVCLDFDIGCDIENLTRKTSLFPIAKRFFSAEETADLKALPESLQRKGFFERWTLKESFVKATGKGLTQGLDTFRFEFKTTSEIKYRDDINLYTEQSKAVDPNWFNALIYPDNKHVIAVSVKTNQAIKINYRGVAAL